MAKIIRLIPLYLSIKIVNKSFDATPTLLVLSVIETTVDLAEVNKGAISCFIVFNLFEIDKTNQLLSLTSLLIKFSFY